MQHTYIAYHRPHLYSSYRTNRILSNSVERISKHICKYTKITSPNKLPSIVPLITQDSEKPHLCPKSLSHIQSIMLIPLTSCTFVSSNRRHRVQSTHNIFLKPLFRTPGTSKRGDSSKSQHRFFSR